MRAGHQPCHDMMSLLHVAAPALNHDTELMQTLKRLIRDIPDFPAPGVIFRDITPLLADADGLAMTITRLAEPWRQGPPPDAVVGIESRGFILGAALARELGTGFVPIRKPGKLPAATLAIDYALEYGHDRLEIHADAVAPGDRVVLVDDVLATGGTLDAARQLLAETGCQLLGASLLIEITALAGRQRWPAHLPLHVLISY